MSVFSNNIVRIFLVLGPFLMDPDPYRFLPGSGSELKFALDL